MSSRESGFRVQDILQAIANIEKYLQGMILTQFRNNQLVVDAVLRNFEIIGEASKGIPSNIKQANSHIPWKQMYRMRNVLIHEYFGVDSHTVWQTAKHHLPELKKQLEHINKKYGAK